MARRLQLVVAASVLAGAAGATARSDGRIALHRYATRRRCAGGATAEEEEEEASPAEPEAPAYDEAAATRAINASAAASS